MNWEMQVGYNSLAKCQLILQQTARFLGFIVDTRAQAFRVPDDKITAFATRMRELDQQVHFSGQEAVQLAGKMISMVLAIGTAPLHSSIVARVLVDLTRWEDASSSPERIL